MTTFKIACQILSLLILIAIPVFYFVKFRKEKLFMKDVLWGFILYMAANLVRNLIGVNMPQMDGIVGSLMLILLWSLTGAGIVATYILLRKYLIKSEISKNDHLIMGFGFVFLNVVQSIPVHISYIMISISDMSGNGFDAVKNMLNTEDVSQINLFLDQFRTITAAQFLEQGLAVLLLGLIVTSMLVILKKYFDTDQRNKGIGLAVGMMIAFQGIGILLLAVQANAILALVIRVLVTAGISYYAYKEYKTI